MGDTAHIKLVRYQASDIDAWNRLIDRSRNGTFLFNRSYMDYHSDRFSDYSFLIYKKNSLAAVIPANRIDDSVYSHQGLTYGGVISTDTVTAVDMLDIFDQWLGQLKEFGVTDVTYKPVPWIYHKLASEDDLYALFRRRATLVACQISSGIFQFNKIPFIESRRSGIRKASSNGVEVKRSEDYDAFWRVLEDVLLAMHKTKPVHSVAEIKQLAACFPNNIKLYLSTLNGCVLAGTVVFITDRVLHVQYMGASLDGKRLGALDAIINHLINIEYYHVPIFDFGVSTEDGGNVLNESLIFQKEGFGGRGIVYDAWRIII